MQVPFVPITLSPGLPIKLYMDSPTIFEIYGIPKLICKRPTMQN